MVYTNNCQLIHYIYGYIYIHVTFLNSCLYLGQTILSLTAVSFSLPSLLAVLILQCRSLADLYFVPPYYQLIRAETGLSLFIYILISPLLDMIIEIHILPDISYWWQVHGRFNCVNTSLFQFFMEVSVMHRDNLTT